MITWEVAAVIQERKEKADGGGNQYLPNHSSILAWRISLTDREAWQATVYRVAKSQTLPK